MADKKIIEFDVEEHGIENSQYFQGAGISGTEYDDIATGIGNNAAEAFDDALEQLAQNDWDVTELEKEKKNYEGGEEVGDDTGSEDEPGDDVYFYLSIRVKGEEEPAESKTKARKIANLAEKLIK